MKKYEIFKIIASIFMLLFLFKFGVKMWPVIFIIPVIYGLQQRIERKNITKFDERELYINDKVASRTYHTIILSLPIIGLILMFIRIGFDFTIIEIIPGHETTAEMLYVLILFFCIFMLEGIFGYIIYNKEE